LNTTVSIITVCYNAAHTIGDALQSVAAQSYPHIEHVVIDGASTDTTLQVIEQFPHVAKTVSEKDDGMYPAINKGIALATGDIIGILHADDTYANHDIITKVVNLFSDPAVDAVYGDLVFVDAHKTQKITRRWKAGPYDVRQLYKGWMPPHPTFFVRANRYTQCGNFNTSFTSAADYELMLRFLLKHSIRTVYLPEVMVRMRQGGRSTASIKNRIIAHLEDWKAWKVNQLRPHFFTLFLKPLRKIRQFIPYE
jgi:glycosyltransferase involved in cell wall biosynthesis